MHPAHGTSKATKMTYLRHRPENRNVMREHLPHKCRQKKNIPAGVGVASQKLQSFNFMEAATVAMAEPIWVARVVPNISTAILIAFEYIKTLGYVGVSNVSADAGGDEADEAICAFRESAASMLFISL